MRTHLVLECKFHLPEWNYLCMYSYAFLCLVLGGTPHFFHMGLFDTGLYGYKKGHAFNANQRNIGLLYAI